MPTNLDLQELERLRAHYTTMRDVCSDMIKQLRGEIPEQSSLVFTVGTLSVAQIPIAEDNANFCAGFFISWYTYYSNQLKDLNTAYNTMVTRVA